MAGTELKALRAENKILKDLIKQYCTDASEADDRAQSHITALQYYRSSDQEKLTKLDRLCFCDHCEVPLVIETHCYDCGTLNTYNGRNYWNEAEKTNDGS